MSSRISTVAGKVFRVSKKRWLKKLAIVLQKKRAREKQICSVLLKFYMNMYVD